MQFSEAKWIGFPERPELTIWEAPGILRWLDILLIVHPRTSAKCGATKSWLIFKIKLEVGRGGFWFGAM